eukprot:TRINITY_DN26544_c0_g1_i1.p1 TRINITY_DN26544_c0_g1~~TRINITY_DN26544_c0_g1_i1.p1  ORF type:complete len:863 (+),score=242.90 TRINITY_DN26544_c0_g1_i1:83-2671(+)
MLLCCLAAAAAASADATSLNVYVAGPLGSGKSRVINAALAASGLGAAPAVVGGASSTRAVTRRLARHCSPPPTGTSCDSACWYDTPALDVCPCLVSCGECPALRSLTSVLRGLSQPWPDWPPEQVHLRDDAHRASALLLVSKGDPRQLAHCASRLQHHLKSRLPNSTSAGRPLREIKVVPVSTAPAQLHRSASFGPVHLDVFGDLTGAGAMQGASAVLTAVAPLCPAQPRRRRWQTELEEDAAKEWAADGERVAADLRAAEEALAARAKAFADDVLSGGSSSLFWLYAGAAALAGAVLLRAGAAAEAEARRVAPGVCEWVSVAGVRVARRARLDGQRAQQVAMPRVAAAKAAAGDVARRTAAARDLVVDRAAQTGAWAPFAVTRAACAAAARAAQWLVCATAAGRALARVAGVCAAYVWRWAARCCRGVALRANVVGAAAVAYMMSAGVTVPRRVRGWVSEVLRRRDQAMARRTAARTAVQVCGDCGHRSRVQRRPVETQTEAPGSLVDAGVTASPDRSRSVDRDAQWQTPPGSPSSPPSALSPGRRVATRDVGLSPDPPPPPQPAAFPSVSLPRAPAEVRAEGMLSRGRASLRRRCAVLYAAATGSVLPGDRVMVRCTDGGVWPAAVVSPSVRDGRPAVLVRWAASGTQVVVPASSIQMPRCAGLRRVLHGGMRGAATVAALPLAALMLPLLGVWYVAGSARRAPPRSRSKLPAPPDTASEAETPEPRRRPVEALPPHTPIHLGLPGVQRCATVELTPPPRRQKSCVSAASGRRRSGISLASPVYDADTDAAVSIADVLGEAEAHRQHLHACAAAADAASGGLERREVTLADVSAGLDRHRSQMSNATSGWLGSGSLMQSQ